MSHPVFSQHLLDLIQEDDRLVGLASAINIQLEEDPVNGQWVLRTEPRRDAPLPFTPSTRYGVDVHELDDAIRSTWGEIAQIAKTSSDETIAEVLDELRLTVPRDTTQSPSYAVWIPTEDPDCFESVRTVIRWTITRFTITPTSEVFQLFRSKKKYSIIDPTGKQHTVTTPPTQSRDTSEAGSLTPMFPFDINDETSIDIAFERAREKGLQRLSQEQHNKLTKVKNRTRLYSFLNGLTIFTGVVAFLFFLYGANMVVPFVGPIIYIAVVAYAYNRD